MHLLDQNVLGLDDSIKKNVVDVRGCDSSPLNWSKSADLVLWTVQKDFCG